MAKYLDMTAIFTCSSSCAIHEIKTNCDGNCRGFLNVDK